MFLRFKLAKSRGLQCYDDKLVQIRIETIYYLNANATAASVLALRTLTLTNMLEDYNAMCVADCRCYYNLNVE